MASVNKVILVGNLGKDPEVRHMPNRFADSNEITSLVLFGGERKVFVPYHDRAVKFVEFRCAA